MNESDASGLLGAGMHEMDEGRELYATECSKMNQDTSAMYTDHSNSSAFLEEHNMPGIQPLGELRFGNTQHFELQSQRMVADSEDESMPSSPDTSSTTNYDMPGYTEQNLQQVYNAYDALVDKDGPVVLSPDFIMCDETSHIEPHLTFSSDGIKIECLDLDLDKMITFDWGLSNIISINCKWAQSVGSALITLFAESEAENGNSGPVRVKFSLDDLQWPRKQQKIWYLEKRYQEIWKNIPSDDFASENWSIEPTLFFPSQYFSNTEDFEDVIYPKGDPDAVSISKRDSELLLPETFVNDTIIDFYIKYLTTRIDSTEKPRYHFFNSFFFRKLADLDKDQGRALEGRAAFLRVRKWTRKINIFEKDFVFIPVNFSLHWSLIVVCYPGAVTLGDGAAKLSAKLPCILHMDSLKGSHSGLKDIIQSYLWEEWKEKHPELAADNADKFLNMRFVSLELPQQDNSFDCGLFLLHYVELFLMDVPSNFNPLKIDAFSSFLSDDWFPPAEASHKRSVIQKLIHEVVAGSLQNHPKLVCSNEQLDEKHQSRNVEREPAGDFPAQSSSADQAELVSTIRDDGAQQSTSICLNDSEEKVLSASGGIVNTGSVSVVAVQNLQEPGVCLPEDDTVVFLSSQDEKNETLVDMKSCDPEDGEALEGSSCGVSYMEHSESLFLTLGDNQKYSSQAEAEVQDVMLSSCHSISYNSEVITYQGYSLQRNTNEVGHECFEPSQDMDSLAMLDNSKDDIGPNSEMMADEDDDNDLGENMGSATQGDINKDVEIKREDSLADDAIVESSIKDSVKGIDSTADNIDHSEQYVLSGLTEGNAGNINAGNSDKVVTCDNEVSSGLNEGNANQTITGGVVTYETNINADGVDAYKHLAPSGAIGCGDAEDEAVPTTCAMAEAVPHEDTTCTQDETVPCEDTTYVMAEAVPCEDTTYAMAEAVPCEDTTCTQAQDGTLPREDTICAMAEAVPCEDTTCTQAQDVTVPHEGDTDCTDAEMPLGDRSCCIKDEAAPENTFSDAKLSLLDGICEEKDIVVSDGKCTQKDDRQGTVAKSPLPDSICDVKDIVLSVDKRIQKDDAQVTDKERHLPDSLCEEKLVSRDECTKKDDARTTDSKRPLPDSICDVKDIVLSGDKCIQKDDAQVTDKERPLPDSLCEEKVVSGDGCTKKDDAHVTKRPLPEGEKDTSVSERCIQKDNLHGTDAKIEQHYKRRKVLAAESKKERSSSGA